MDAIEKAIRNAFEKGDAEDRAFREKVYRSAFAALDRALQANPSITVETAINRRKSVQAKIAEIESEYLPAVAAVAPEALGASAGPGDGAGGETSPVAPAIEAVPGEAGAEAVQSRVLPVVPDIMPEPALPGSRPVEMPTLVSGRATAGSEVSPDRDDRRARRRRVPFAGLFIGITLLAAVGIGVWWAVQTGLVKLPGAIDFSVPSVPPTVEDEDYQPGEPAKPGLPDQARDWITVFSPADPSKVSAPADTKADAMQDATGSFLRIRSGASGSAISFDVGQGILEKLAGKHAIFDIVARAEDGKDTQISVDCNFGELGDCGRKRYAVGHERNEYLFDVQMPDKRPGASGTIAINSDFDKQGRSVDIYEIRVSIAEE